MQSKSTKTKAVESWTAEFTDSTHPEAVYQGLLDAGIYALHSCRDCRSAHFPPRVLCPHCGSTSLEWRKVSGFGTLYSASTVFPRGSEPYVVALVDLDEGPRVMTSVNVNSNVEVDIGQRLRVRIETREGVSIPLFVPHRSTSTSLHTQ